MVYLKSTIPWPVRKAEFAVFSDLFHMVAFIYEIIIFCYWMLSSLEVVTHVLFWTSRFVSAHQPVVTNGTGVLSFLQDAKGNFVSFLHATINLYPISG